MINLRSGILGLTLTSALVLAATSANAADIYNRAPAVGGYKDGPVYAVNSWTGFYIGANGGYAFSANDDLFANNAHGNFKGLEPEGGFGGGQIGYNFGGGGFLGSQFVLGIEADFQGSDISDTGSLNGVSYRSNIDWFGTVRGRIGYAMDRTLIYATGGFAYGDVKTRINDTNGPTGGDIFRSNDTQTGYVVGGGIETKISPNWSIKAEYQYINLGSELGKNDGGFTYANTPSHAGTTFSDKDTELHTARVGLNYHFNTPYESLK